MAHEPTDGRGRMYHTGLSKKDVGRIAFLPGDPARVARIAERFGRGERIASHREYVTYAGRLAGERVVAVSTGIGGPSAAIAVEELARLGVKVMVRIGTCGAIQPDLKVGSLVIADSAVRLDGATRQYVMEGYPAAATPQVVIALAEQAAALRKRASVGTAASTDSFFVGQGRKGFGGYFTAESATLVEDLRRARVLCFEMESSTIFTLARIFGLSSGAVFAVVANRVSNEFDPDAGIEDAIDVAVGSVIRLGKLGARPFR